MKQERKLGQDGEKERKREREKERKKERDEPKFQIGIEKFNSMPAGR